MIFAGSGCRPGLLDQLGKLTRVEDWQFKEGDFRDLSFEKKSSITRLSTDKSILDGSVFWESSLAGCDMTRSNLQGVKFLNTQVEDSRWVSSLLRESVWENAELKGTTFLGCSAPRLRMSRVTLKGCQLAENEISHGKMEGITAYKSTFRAEHESGLTGFRKTEFKQCLFVNCHFYGDLFSQCDMDRVLFLGCQFFHTPWERVTLKGSHFVQCQGSYPSQSPQRREMTSDKSIWADFEKELSCE